MLPTQQTPDILKVSILGSDSIRIGFHLTPYMVSTILSDVPSSTYVIITDTNLSSLYLPRLRSEFETQTAGLEGKAKPRILHFEVPPGEGAKSRKQKEMIEDFMLEKRCTRDSVVLALGGGVVGDLSGFVAATFMRGLRVVQIPTTLLSMVDSSVGGKTAIDTRHGKNFIGAFWQPTFIFVDLSFLETLNMREFANGMAEVIKTAAIWKEDDFEKLESRANEIISAVQSGSTVSTLTGQTLSTRTEAQELLLAVVTGSIYVKAHIVTIDERETGLRNLVNFGHTIGHAIEAVVSPKILHGECVAVGMVLEAEVARQLGTLSQVAVGRITRCLVAYGLPISMSDSRIASLPTSKLLTTDRLLDIMKVDKKNYGGTKKIVLLSRIGKTWEEKASAVEDAVIKRVLTEAVRVYRSIPKTPSNGLVNGNGHANGHAKVEEGIVMSTPGSKSISNRALVLAALGKGTCRMRNLLHSDDTAVMMSALVDLKGAQFSWEDGGDTLVVKGGEGVLSAPISEKSVYLQNAGTAARFLTSVCALVASNPSGPAHTTITGNTRMRQRPIGPLVDALRENGNTIDYVESQGCLPLKIKTGGMKGGHIKLAASVSSQYVSSILLCAPYATEAITLELTGGQVISQPYIDMTIAMMAEFGIPVTRKTGASGELLDVYTIPKGTYVNPEVYNVESDASSATYPLAIAAITGTTCTISNIGSSSLQGDAGFAKNVLEKMGCKVEQTASRTTVTGPPIGQLHALGEIDMETMTDAFLTASVLAAIAVKAPTIGQVAAEGGENVTRIRGIANQRVKECNRIKAMRDQLEKFGVKTDEFDDGIIVYGRNYEELKADVNVHCYDDHRVGMAFSVLACVVSETVLNEKRCVEKTWPNYWDDISRIMGINVIGEDLINASEQASSSDLFNTTQSTVDYAQGATIFLIGMRGAGKTFLGTMAGDLLNRPFLDADEYFVAQEGMQISDLVKKSGWPAFRAKEVEHLAKLMSENSHGYVVSLGGGVVESPGARELLKNYAAERGPVVHIAREIDEIRAYLGEIGDSTVQRPGYVESAQDVFRRRQPWFYECSNYDYVNYTGMALHPGKLLVNGDSDENSPDKGTRLEATRFFKYISSADLNRPVLSAARPSSFLSLTLPDISPALKELDRILVGADAVELRVDLLSPTGESPTNPTCPPYPYVGLQLAALRQHTRLPIVFSVRTFSQGGMFPDDAVDQYFALVQLGIRLGCEYVDVEMQWPVEKINGLVARKGLSQLIASWHDWSGNAKWDGPEVKERYEAGAKFGDIVKLVGTAKDHEDNTKLATFVSSINKVEGSKPLLAINMGATGQLSRVLNPILTPITHALLPTRAAPGQMSFAQVQQALHLVGRLPAKKYFIFGTPIQASLSPVIHNTGFQLLGLPHVYGRHETSEVDSSVSNIMDDPDFGGASVTIPHKLAIMPHLHEISADARLIGAVNTVTVRVGPDGGRQLFGDNSDWKAMTLMAKRHLPTGYSISPTTTSLVIGAGGTCRAAVYALYKLGVPTIYLYNRTLANAQKIVAAFPKAYNIVCITSMETFPAAPPTIIISTVPGDGNTLDSSAPGILLKPSLLASPHGGVAIDMAYRPHITALLSLAKSHSASPWTVVPGVEILCEQAFVQFEGWTDRKAPSRIMRETALEKYHA